MRPKILHFSQASNCRCPWSWATSKVLIYIIINYL